MNLNIQIFGTLKCKDTNKALRFFKERGISPHLVELNKYPMKKGELNNISQAIQIEDLIDRDGKEFKKLNLQYKVYDTEQELLENPLLFITPIVRNGRKATVGEASDIWKKWISDAKQ